MINEWVRAGLDVVLILLVGVGVVQASRLIKHLIGLQQGRVEMERFVRDFNATVMRAEAGIKGLRQAARDSGDDLEKLVEKAVQVKDELTYIVESADKAADRLSKNVANVLRPDAKMDSNKDSVVPDASGLMRKPEMKETSQPSSRAEKELLQALQKLS